MKILLLIFVVGYITAAPSFINKVDDDFANEFLIRSLYEPNKIKENIVKPSFHFDGSSFREHDNATMVGFSWKNCGSPDDPIQVNELAISPEPITIPGTEVVDVDAKIAKEVDTITQLKLVIKKKIFGVFIEVPCVDNIGSCTYDNPCDLLKNITCPPEFIKAGFTCRCPFKANTYKLDKVSVKIPAIKLPSFIEDGDYEVEGTLMNGSSRVACYSVTASLKSA